MGCTTACSEVVFQWKPLSLVSKLRPHSLPATKKDALSTALHTFSAPYCWLQVGFSAQSSVQIAFVALSTKKLKGILAFRHLWYWVKTCHNVCSDSQCRLWVGSIAVVLLRQFLKHKTFIFFFQMISLQVRILQGSLLILSIPKVLKADLKLIFNMSTLSNSPVKCKKRDYFVKLIFH